MPTHCLTFTQKLLSIVWMLKIKLSDERASEPPVGFKDSSADFLPCSHTHTHTHPEPCSVCVWSIRTMKTASMTESDDSSCLSVSNNTPGLTTSFFLGKISLKPTQSKTQRVRELWKRHQPGWEDVLSSPAALQQLWSWRVSCCFINCTSGSVQLLFTGRISLQSWCNVLIFISHPHLWLMMINDGEYVLIHSCVVRLLSVSVSQTANALLATFKDNT